MEEWIPKVGDIVFILVNYELKVAELEYGSDDYPNVFHVKDGGNDPKISPVCYAQIPYVQHETETPIYNMGPFFRTEDDAALYRDTLAIRNSIRLHNEAAKFEKKLPEILGKMDNKGFEYKYFN